MVAEPVPAGGRSDDLLSSERFADLAERPLLVPSRRPVVIATQAPERGPVAAVQPPRPEPVPPLVLIGVVMQAGGRTAVVALGATTRHLAEGQEIEGWRLERIEPDRLVLRRNGLETVVKFPVGHNRR